MTEEFRELCEASNRVQLGLRVEALPVDTATAELAAALARNRDVQEVEFIVRPGPLLSRTAALIRALIRHPSVRSLRVVGVGWEHMLPELGGPDAFGVNPALG